MRQRAVLMFICTAVVMLAGGGTGTGAAKPSCTVKTADAAMRAVGMAREFGAKHIAGDVVCGSFLGPGSLGMAATIYHGVCRPNAGWVVFRFGGGTWQQVPNDGSYIAVARLKVVGGDLREIWQRARKGDTICNPTGGAEGREWHWDGMAFKPGPRHRLAERKPRSFHSPSRGITCTMTDNDLRIDVVCVSRREPKPASVLMAAGGRLTSTCAGYDYCPTVFGPQHAKRELAYGKRLTVGRFRCRSEQDGVTCTDRTTGRGFRISNTGVRRVRPAAAQTRT